MNYITISICLCTICLSYLMVADVYLKCCIWLRWETKCRKYESVLEWSLASFGRDSSVCQQFMKYCNSTIKISYTKILLKLQQIISTSRAQPGIREQILCCFKAFMWVLHRYLSSHKKKKTISPKIINIVKNKCSITHLFLF